MSSSPEKQAAEVKIEARDDDLRDVPSLLDWRRRVAMLYDEVRAEPDPRAGLGALAGDSRPADRVALAIAARRRGPHRVPGRSVFRLRPRLPCDGAIVRKDPIDCEIGTSRWSSYRFTRFATAEFELLGRQLSLDCFWLEGYAGGLFLPFGDPTNGVSTYAAGRYLLDTAKGADLGWDDETLVLDFNFAYNPSCAYHPRWVCPLTPIENRLSAPIQAGERLFPAG